MKKWTLSVLAALACCLPLGIRAQFMADYFPNTSYVTPGNINLVTVVESFASNSGFSHSVNTVQEDAFSSATTDVWVHAVDRVGVPVLSLRYGQPDVNESAAAITRCRNGDFIVLANTEADGIICPWLFRIDINGNVLWSIRYYNPDQKLRAYCIKNITEATGVENYAVAGTANSDTDVMAFKVDGSGNLLWHLVYRDIATSGTVNIPKTMLVNGNVVMIAGNRSFGINPNRDIFLIGVRSVDGLVSVQYRHIDNGGRDDFDPFLNFARNGQFVLVYRCVANIGGVNTGRIAFNRLTNTFTLALANTALSWENGTRDTYGHSIYLENGTLNTRFWVGGGTTAGNLRNPLFVALDNNGSPIAGTYRRLWIDRDMVSTFMMQDAFNITNQYEHHNYFVNLAVDPQPGNMSLLRDQSLPSPCNRFPTITRTTVPASLTPKEYREERILEPKELPYIIKEVNGDYRTCPNGGGTFRTTRSIPVTEEPVADKNSFKVFPTLVNAGTPVKVNFSATRDEMATITVYNLQGQQVWRQSEKARQGQNQVLLTEIGNLPAGTFMVELRLGNESFKTKLVRQ
jgi:hypothetical protein